MVRLTYVDLINDAVSRDPAIRQRGFRTYQQWLAAERELRPDKRLTYVEKSVLNQIFAQNGMKLSKR